MKFHIIFLIVFLALALTTQAFHLKSAIKKKLPTISSIIPSISKITSSLTHPLKSANSLESISTQVGTTQTAASSFGSISSLSGTQQTVDSLYSLSASIPPTVTLYSYPPQHQVIYRSIRPVVRRTVYDSTANDDFRGIQDVIGNLIPNPIAGGISGIKSAIGNIFRAATQQTIPVPSSQVYYSVY